MIGALILDAAAAQTVQVPFEHIGLGTVLQGVMFLLACGGFYFNLRKHRADTERTSRDAEERIVNALKTEIAEKHRENCDDVADLEEDIGKLSDKVDTFMPAEKIEGLVKTGVDGLKHNHSQELQKQLIRIERLESGRTADVERIVKLESNMSNIEKSQTRIEHALDGLSKDLGTRIDSWADKLSTSIREIRDVKPRG